MKPMTISEALRTVINEREVTHAFFSTYSFEPDFFELEVLPLLLGNPALSSNETLRYHQLQDLMRQYIGRLAVVYDQSVFDPQLAPRLEVDYLPLRVEGACQHAKLTILVVNDSASEQRSIILGAGSFNLTKSGWWENIEVGHWVELRPGFAPDNIHMPLLGALRFYQDRMPPSVMQNILDAAQSLVTTAADPSCSFYFSGRGTERIHFDTFIAEQTNAEAPLEIISPFFATRGDNLFILDLLKRHPSVTVLLPLDEQGQALVDRQSVYEVLRDENVNWGRWSERIRKSHLPNGGYRRLHAKVYQSPGEEAWAFIGSVNLSYKAFRENVEAGFLLRGQRVESLLAPLQTSPDRFKIESEVEGQSKSGEQEMPAIHALFDWQDETIRLSCTKSGLLILLNSTSEELLSIQLDAAVGSTVAAAQLKQYLQHSSLLHACWRSDEQATTGVVLVSQRNIFCRPSHLPALDLQALLRIFLGMDDSRRLELVGDLAIRLLRTNQGPQDEFLPELKPEGAAESFFAEFSQVNGAFWELAGRLEKADPQTLAYYLKGQQPDSIRKLLEATVESNADKARPSLIVRYLTLLSIIDLLNRFIEHTDPSTLHDAEKALSVLEHSELLPQLDDADGERFLSWFKTKFFEPVG